MNDQKNNILVMYSTEAPTHRHLNNLSVIAHGYNVIYVKTESEAIQNAKNATIILGHRYLWQI